MADSWSAAPKNVLRKKFYWTCSIGVKSKNFCTGTSHNEVNQYVRKKEKNFFNLKICAPIRDNYLLWDSWHFFGTDFFWHWHFSVSYTTYFSQKPFLLPHPLIMLGQITYVVMIDRFVIISKKLSGYGMFEVCCSVRVQNWKKNCSSSKIFSVRPNSDRMIWIHITHGQKSQNLI